MNDHANQLALAIRTQRLRLALRQEEVAELAGCSTRFVHTAEAGKTTLRLDKLLAVLRVLGLGLVVTAGRGDIIPGDARNIGDTAR